MGTIQDMQEGYEDMMDLPVSAYMTTLIHSSFSILKQN